MNYYFITGTSSGIGEALAKLILRNENNSVFGISRRQTINHPNYRHLSIDLSDLNYFKHLAFPEMDGAESVSLINNSAYTSLITHFVKTDPDEIVKSYNVNIVSPSLLINCFLKKYQRCNCRRVIMNISSGAGKTPFESMSVYCASKAALDMLSRVLDIEQKLNHPENPVYVFSVAPGIVNTRAQENIRMTKPEHFSEVGRFIEFKEKNLLTEPADVATKLLQILEHPENHESVLLDVRNMS